LSFRIKAFFGVKRGSFLSFKKQNVFRVKEKLFFPFENIRFVFNREGVRLEEKPSFSV